MLKSSHILQIPSIKKSFIKKIKKNIISIREKDFLFNPCCTTIEALLVGKVFHSMYVFKFQIIITLFCTSYKFLIYSEDSTPFVITRMIKILE
jgi:hypothetical protein